MDIRFDRPDAFLLIPPGDRPRLTLDGDDACAIRNRDDTQRHYYLRVALPIPIQGETKPFCWGIWVEVASNDFQRVFELWDDAHQTDHPPIPATLANCIAEFEGSLGLPGTVRLTGPTSIPWLTLDPTLEHPLAQVHRSGVFLEQVLEWSAARLPH